MCSALYDRLEEDTQILPEKAFNEAINLTLHLLERLAAATKTNYLDSTQVPIRVSRWCADGNPCGTSHGHYMFGSYKMFSSL